MNILRKISVFLLTLVLASGMVLTELPLGSSFTSTALAANSPDKGPVTPTTQVGVEITGKNTVAITSISSKEKKVTIPATISSNGETYIVSKIKKGSIKEKYDQVTLILDTSTEVDKTICVTKKAKKTKKIVIKANDNKKKLKARQFNKTGFKGFKGKIIVKKSAMTKKEFKKLVKKLRKGGFKGKIVRKNG